MNHIRSPLIKFVPFWCWFVVFPKSWSNVNVTWGNFCYDELFPCCDVEVPNKSKPKISSLDFGPVGAFFACPGPMIALLGYVFFYFLAFSLIKVFISVTFLVGSSLYPGSTNVSYG